MAIDKHGGLDRLRAEEVPRPRLIEDVVTLKVRAVRVIR
jgi:NADPH:quinone reductase-like Zn-dependent oxidoreductase